MACSFSTVFQFRTVADGPPFALPCGRRSRPRRKPGREDVRRIEGSTGGAALHQTGGTQVDSSGREFQARVVPATTGTTAATQHRWRSQGEPDLILTPAAGTNDHEYVVIEHALITAADNSSRLCLSTASRVAVAARRRQRAVGMFAGRR
jgi:hypothetical protein